jgi:hypothetical protein
MGKSLDQLVKGMGVGAMSVLDPISSALIHPIDLGLTGVGLSDKRAIPTVYANTYKAVYPKPDEKLSAGTYATRFGGQLIGGVGTGLGLYAVGAAISPILALAAPVALGIYGIVRAVGQYAHDYFKGEKIDGKHQKASFLDGLRFGYHRGSYTLPLGRFSFSPMELHHNYEASLTGRGYGNSHIDSRIRQSAAPMRRNFAAAAGNIVGQVGGALVSVLSLGIVPLYKTLRDWGRTAKGELRPVYQSA